MYQHLELIRLAQLAHGGLVHPEKRGTIWEGYTFVKPRTRHSSTLTAVIRKQFPTGHRELDRELSRTLAALEDSDALSLEKITNHILITQHPVDQIHYLTVLARLKAVRTGSVTPTIVDALLDLGPKIRALQIRRDRHWPLRMEELHRELSRQDTHLNKQLSTHPNFGQPDHLVFTRHPDLKSHVTATRFLEQLKDTPSFRWTASLIEVLEIFPDDQLFPLLREQWENTSLHPPLIRTLSRNPQPEDHPLFLESLESPSRETLIHGIQALQKIYAMHSAEEASTFIRTLRRLPENKAYLSPKEDIGKLLRRTSNQTFPNDDFASWTDWYLKTYPEQFEQLEGPVSIAWDQWQQRLAKIIWNKGNRTRGRLVFEQFSCVSCHSGARALGPDLRGVTARFSVTDLFRVILDPNRDVSPRYQLTVVTTREGKIFQGAVIYRAVDGLILQTGPETTVRIEGDQIDTVSYSTTSLMPQGLIQSPTDEQLQDLYASSKASGNPVRTK